MSNIRDRQWKRSVRDPERREAIECLLHSLERLLERDRFFDAESAKTLGLIDKVLEHPIQDMQLEDEKQSKPKN